MSRPNRPGGLYTPRDLTRLTGDLRRHCKWCGYLDCPLPKREHAPERLEEGRLFWAAQKKAHE